MSEVTFTNHEAACEYMGETNPTFAAWSEGPHIGALRIAYVAAHKEHCAAVETRDTALCEKTHAAFCKAKNDLTDALHRT